VHKILQRIQQRELKNLSEHFAAIKAEVSGQLDYIIEQTSESWERSKEPRKRANQKTDGDGDEITSTDVVEQCGDVSYLKTWMEAASMKMSLFGLHVQPASNEVNFTISELVEDMEKKAKEYESGEGARKTWGEQDWGKKDDEATKAAGEAAGVLSYRL
jgi:hypothetical protein